MILGVGALGAESFGYDSALEVSLDASSLSTLVTVKVGAAGSEAGLNSMAGLTDPFLLLWFT